MTKQEYTKVKEIFKAINDGMELMDGLEMKKVSTFRGHDGDGYLQGDLYYNGEKVAFVGEDAWCGPLDYEFYNQEVAEKITKFVEDKNFVVPLSHTMKDKTIHVDLELYLNTVLAFFHHILSVKRKTSKTFIFDTNNGKEYYYNVPFTREAEMAIRGKLEKGQVIMNFSYRNK